MDHIVQSFLKQAFYCNAMESPLTAAVLEGAADDIKANGFVAGLMAGWKGNPEAGALPLRFAGALHYLVLAGRAEELEGFYPSAGGAMQGDDSKARLWRAVRAVLAREGEVVRAFLEHPPQTNEVRRSAVLLGGFLEVAARTGLPLRLFEIGASAGLNMNWDRFYYQLQRENGETASWGDASSPVTMTTDWRGGLPPLNISPRIAGRRGCDVKLVMLSDTESVRHLEAFVWPDQPDRLARLRGAISVAHTAGTQVEQADAAAWVAQTVAPEEPGVTRVLYHSIMWTYLPEASQTAIRQTLEQAGARADSTTPLAWLRMENPVLDKPSDLTLTLWPDGSTQRLAVAHPHGASLRWLS